MKVLHTMNVYLHTMNDNDRTMNDVALRVLARIPYRSYYSIRVFHNCRGSRLDKNVKSLRTNHCAASRFDGTDDTIDFWHQR